MLNSPTTAGSADRLAAATDQDQSRRAGQRSQSDHILSLAQHLKPQERFLIEQVFEHGLRLSDIAEQHGKCRSTIQYHVKKLLKRMSGPLFRFLVAHEEVLNKAMQRTGRLVILEGRPLREAARLQRISLHHVRRHLDVIRSLARL